DEITLWIDELENIGERVVLAAQIRAAQRDCNHLRAAGITRLTHQLRRRELARAEDQSGAKFVTRNGQWALRWRHDRQDRRVNRGCRGSSDKLQDPHTELQRNSKSQTPNSNNTCLSNRRSGRSAFELEAWSLGFGTHCLPPQRSIAGLFGRPCGTFVHCASRLNALDSQPST